MNNYTNPIMATITAFRMDGLGNDFLIIDRREKNIHFSKEKIIELADRKKIGFDQIIFLEKEEDNTTPILIFNSDGNEVAACGNGTRCVSYLLGKEKNLNNILLKTTERTLDTEIVGNLTVRVNMGKPLFDWNQIPLSKKLDHKNINIEIIDTKNNKFNEGFALNVGNPHLIFFVKNCFDFNLRELGPKLEHNELFPEQCNVTLAQVVDKNNITVNVWERGAGLTKACGTAACATAVASFLKNLTERNCNIKFKEGILNINFDENENIYMTGPVSDIKKIDINI
ncbi:MAG: diaminopimelate epimerase [Pelagibacteraceae bacterium]